MARGLRFGLLPATVALGLFAEWASLRSGQFEQPASAAAVRLAVADLVVGLVLVTCGLIAWDRRPESWTGMLLTLAGVTWFLGTFAGSGWPGFAEFGGVFVTLHWGPLVHGLLGYPSGKPTGWTARAAVGVGYALSVIAAAGDTAVASVALAAVVLAAALHRFRDATGPERQARLNALAAAAAFSSVLLLSGATRLVGTSAATNRGVLWAYQVVIVIVAVGLTADLVLGRWTRSTVAGLVVDLGEHGEPVSLRDRLSAALGDPSLVVGYRLPERDAYVDDTGQDVELPSAGSERVATIVWDGDEPVAALVHVRSATSDRDLLDAVAAAARIAVANARLQAEVRRRLEELEASRRRIVEAADAQRRRLESELRKGAEQRLTEVAALLGQLDEDRSGPAFRATLDETRAELERAQTELSEFARGIHPRVLAEGGLPAGLADLVRRAAVPVRLSVADGRFAPPVEAAAYFVCSEALANIGKYAEASEAALAVEEREGALVVSVRDDGRGGASVAAGSGLRGLADRVEALGGHLTVESPPGHGTLLVAELPITDPGGRGDR